MTLQKYPYCWYALELLIDISDAYLKRVAEKQQCMSAGKTIGKSISK